MANETTIGPGDTFVPDDNFEQALIDLGYDSGPLDDYVPTANINSITNLELDAVNISNLTGIEGFTSITTLSCFNSQLTTLDLSNNINLVRLDCRNSQLTNINLSNNTELTSLRCNNNQLTELDISTNTKLVTLRCNNNQLTSLDVSNNGELYFFSCHDNQLTSLDVSNHLQLGYLLCSENRLTSLDLSNNPQLVHLRCESNELITLDLKNGANSNLESLFGRGNPNLSCISVDDEDLMISNHTRIDSHTSFSENCNQDGITFIPDANFEQALIDLGHDSGVIDGQVITDNINTITELDISFKRITDLSGIEGFTSLTNLICNTNQIHVLDLSNNLQLTSLICYSNQVEILDLSNNLQLTSLIYYSNQLETLDLSSNIQLTHLECEGNNFTSLDLSSNIQLTRLECARNNLTSLDLSNNNLLTHLECDRNDLLTLDISNNSQLSTLSCYQNQLPNLDLSNNVQLHRLECYQNQLTNLDVSNSPELRVIRCNDNQLSQLNLSNNPRLQRLQCFSNQLTTLNISSNLELIQLDCYGNRLTSLDVHNKRELDHLQCGRNNLTTLNLSNSPKLRVLTCGNNDLVELNVNNGNIRGVNRSVFYTTDNPNLTCISVDDVAWSAVSLIHVDAHTSFSENCNQGVTLIPDVNFEQTLIDLGYDSGVIDGQVVTGNINTITALNVDNRNISDLTGIDDFTALVDLTCDRNQLVHLDVSKNTNLTKLSCYVNQISSIDLSQNLALETLYINNNNLTSLDLNHNTQLLGLICSNNNFSGIDISNNLALDLLYAQNLSISSLDVSQHTALRVLYVDNNNITSLDLSNNPLLTHVRVENNQLTLLNVNNGAIAEMNTFNFNTTGNPNLSCISVNDLAWSTANLLDIDPQTTFSEDCSASSRIMIYVRKEGTSNASRIHVWPNEPESVTSNWPNNLQFMIASSTYSDYFEYEVKNGQATVNALFLFDGVQSTGQNNITQDTWFTIGSNGMVSSTTTAPVQPTTPVLTVSNGGTFTTGTTQTLSASATLGAVIFYSSSTTGVPVNPTISSTRYTGSIPVSSDVTYKFIAYNGAHTSTISTVNYTFVEEQRGIRIYARKEGTSNVPEIHAWPDLTNWDNKPEMEVSTAYSDYFVYEVPSDYSTVNCLFLFDGVQTLDQENITQDTWFTVASNGSVRSTTTVPVPPTTPGLTVSNGGTFTVGTTEVVNASATLGAAIRYTSSTTGVPANPTHSSPLYTGAISVSSDVTYKFIAYNGVHVSTISTVSYTFIEEEPGIRIYVRKNGTNSAPEIHAWPNLTNWDNKPEMEVSTAYSDYFVYEVPSDYSTVNCLFLFDGVQTLDQENITQDTWFTVASNGSVTSTTTVPVLSTIPVLTVPNGGTFTLGTTQNLNASANLGAAIRYTSSTTGVPVNPTESSSLYTGAISVSSDVTYKFIAYNGVHASTISTVGYTFIEEQPSIRIYARKEGTSNAPRIHVWPNEPESVTSNWPNNLQFMMASSTYSDYFEYEVKNDQATVNALFLFDSVQSIDQNNITQNTWFTIADNGIVTSTTTPPNINRGASVLSVTQVAVDQTSGLVVAPSPASTYVQVNYPYSGNESGTIEIYNLSGQLVVFKSFNSQAELLEKIDVSQVPNGIHVLRIQVREYNEIKKFSIVR